MLTSNDQATYDVALFNADTDRRRAADFRDALAAAGLRVFVLHGPTVGPAGQPDDATFDELRNCVHLAIYCSSPVELPELALRYASEFSTRSDLTPHLRRLVPISVVVDESMSAEGVEALLRLNPAVRDLVEVRHPADVLRMVARQRLDDLVEALDEARALARQSFDYYRHARFWQPMSQPAEATRLAVGRSSLHVFTCGRDTVQDVEQRGLGGRTNIDKWDYQAAVDITHHFARHHRDIGVVIEQPVSKARIDRNTRVFNITEFSRMLADRNCVVIGSPDVSDFAEITLAQLLGVQPYSPETPLTTGFKIIKDGQRFSTFYEATSPEKKDGVLLISKTGTQRFECTGSRTYGIIIMANNPFSRVSNEPDRKPDKILILAGHTGVATRGVSLLLTNEEPWCLDEFYKLDQEVAVLNGSFIAVVEVNFNRHPGDRTVGDDRFILDEPGKICFVAAMPLNT
jgi:hypothetical protein